jgi:biopolymer transport protein TolQ
MTEAFSNDIIQMMVQAGLVVKIVLSILVFFSITSWTIIFTKWRLLSKAKRETEYFLDLFWENKEFAKVFNESNDLNCSPIANLFKSGYSELGRTRTLQPSFSSGDEAGIQLYIENIERTLKKTLIHQNHRLEKTLSFLATTGNAAPFIGLFGTVWGIMESFRSIGLKGSASLAVVAPGISEALIATAVGLAAAIPAVVAYNYFSQRVMELRTEMDSFSSDFLGIIKRQFLRRRKASKEE